MIGFLRSPIRNLLQMWGSIGRKPGWRYRLIERIGPWLASPLSDGLIARLPNGLSVQCDLRDHVQRQIYFSGCYEPVESMIFARLIKPGMIIVDAGANVGNYTLLAATAVGETGRVYAFEPVPATYSRLTTAIALNNLKNVTANRSALWDEPATLTLGLPSGRGRNDGSYTVSANGASISAEAQPLDSYLEKVGIAHVDVIKMDIEGAEFRALRGMRKTLMRDHPLLLMEVNRDAAHAAGSTTEQLGHLLLKELGYRAWAIEDSGGGLLDSIDNLVQANVLFFQGDVPAAVCEMPGVREACRWARSGGRLERRNRA